MATVQMIGLEMTSEPPMSKANINKDVVLVLDGIQYACKVKIQQYHDAPATQIPAKLNFSATGSADISA